MRLKADPLECLHDLKRREIGRVFADCPKQYFRKGLELGAGDGYASTLLAEYVQELICTDLNPRRLTCTDAANVSFRILDAEAVGERFPAGEFDLVFSSSLLEHLPDSRRALRGIHEILRDDGISIHLMPNRLWKVATVLLYMPNRLITTVEKLFARAVPSAAGSRRARQRPYGGNNLKLARRRQFFLAKPFLPRPHGVSSNTVAEFLAFGKTRWRHEFEAAGFHVLAIRKVAFSSGYHFGYPRVVALMEKLGLHTVVAFVVCKRGSSPRAVRYFVPEAHDADGLAATTSHVCASDTSPGTKQ